MRCERHTAPLAKQAKVPGGIHRKECHNPLFEETISAETVADQVLMCQCRGGVPIVLMIEVAEGESRETGSFNRYFLREIPGGQRHIPHRTASSPAASHSRSAIACAQRPLHAPSEPRLEFLDEMSLLDSPSCLRNARP